MKMNLVYECTVSSKGQEENSALVMVTFDY